MKKIKSSILVIGLVFSVAINSQTNNLTSSPYSLFGLGVESSISSGRNTAMGNTGIALDASNGFNLYNPAAFASMLEDNFVLEFGVTSEMVNISNSDINESRNTYNWVLDIVQNSIIYFLQRTTIKDFGLTLTKQMPLATM